MARDLARKAFRDLRGSAVGWGAGLSLLAALTTAVYPSIRDNEALQAYYDSLPEAARTLTGGAGDFTSVAGFFQAEIFSYLPVVLAVLTVGKAAQLTLGEEESGTMDLVLAQPVARWRVPVDRFVGLAGAVLVVVTALGATLALVGGLVGIAPADLAALAVWCLLAGLEALLFGAVAVAAAGFAHRKRSAILAGTAVAVGGFLFDGLAPLSSWLDPWRWIGPHGWYARTNPVAGTVSWAGLAALVVATVALVALGAWGYERKDIGV